MKTFSLLAAFAASALLAPSARAFWFGSSGSRLSNDRSEIQAVYDTGSREIEPTGGGRSFDMDTDRFYLEYSQGFGNGLDLFGRFMPETGNATFEHMGGYNPSIWGFGGGLHWAPVQSGRVHWGAQANLDWNQGKDQGVKLNVTEMALMGGPSFRASRNVDVYGGASFMKSNVTLDNGTNKAKFVLSNTFGLFGGVGVNPTPAMTLAFEVHLINEAIFGFSAAYRFGGGSSGAPRHPSQHRRHGHK
jgi:hypothetical protein